MKFWNLLGDALLLRWIFRKFHANSASSAVNETVRRDLYNTGGAGRAAGSVPTPTKRYSHPAYDGPLNRRQYEALMRDPEDLDMLEDLEGEDDFDDEMCHYDHHHYDADDYGLRDTMSDPDDFDYDSGYDAGRYDFDDHDY